MSASLNAGNIRAVIFDAVGTLIHPVEPVADSYCRVIERHVGRQLNRQDVQKVVRDELRGRSAGPDEADLATSEADELRFWQHLVHQLCPSPDHSQACFDELFAYFAAPDAWRCFDDSVDVLNVLNRRDLQLAVGSNFDLRLHDVCDALMPIFGLTQRIVSSEIGWRKPARQFFLAAAAQLGCQPGQILMVGDDFQNDVVGAIRAGCQAVWLNLKENTMSGRTAAIVETPSGLTEDSLVENHGVENREANSHGPKSHGVENGWLQISCLAELPNLLGVA